MWTLLKVRLTTDSDIVAIEAGTTVSVSPGDALMSSLGLVEILEKHANQLVLREPWVGATQSEECKVLPTWGDFNQAVREIRLLREATTNNYGEMEAFWTKLGEVTFKSYSDEEFTFKTARQTITDLAVVEQQMNDAAEQALALVTQYDAQLGEAYLRVLAARDASEQSANNAAQSFQGASEKAEQTAQDAVATSQDRALVVERAEQTARDVLATGESKQLAQQAAQTATQKAEQTAQDAVATSQDRALVVERAEQTELDVLATGESRQLAQQAAQTATQKAEQTAQDALATSQDRALVVERAEQTELDVLATGESKQLAQQAAQTATTQANVSTEQATIATEQAALSKAHADRAGELVDQVTGGSLLKEANLSDLISATEARSNLNVYSQQQVENRLDKKVDRLSLSVSSVSFVYESDRLTEQTVQHGDGVETITHIYEGDQLVRSNSLRNGITTTTNYTYLAGQLVGMEVTTA
ncbi:TPA: hypothetical protein I7122_21495 [Vibrio vulnificus]|nr:hypothetical protein [Vibrio vulnificus]